MTSKHVTRSRSCGPVGRRFSKRQRTHKRRRRDARELRGGLWRCLYCRRLCGPEEGGADDLPEGCDRCWAVADRLDFSTFDFSFMARVLPVQQGGL